jgi:thiol-disulfide isomerase/thioredoxin
MRRAARALACAAVLALAGCRSAPEARPEVVLDDAAFLRQLRSLPAVGPAVQGVRLTGNVVLVSFFATWCFPCIAELPTLQALQRDHGPRGFQVVGVGMDLEGQKVLEPFAYQMELNYPVLLADQRMLDGQSAFGPIRALPTSFLLDREGRALGAWQGVAPHEALSEAIEKALKR